MSYASCLYTIIKKRTVYWYYTTPVIPLTFPALELFDYINFAFWRSWLQMVLFYVGLSNNLFTNLEVYVMFGSLCWGSHYLPYVVHQLVIWCWSYPHHLPLVSLFLMSCHLTSLVCDLFIFSEYELKFRSKMVQVISKQMIWNWTIESICQIESF